MKGVANEEENVCNYRLTMAKGKNKTKIKYESIFCLFLKRKKQKKIEKKN
jgi:hypothetical protein